jgi:hypothetical protein
MSLEIFRINENGAGWVSLENATIAEKLELELALAFNAEMKVLCVTCHIEIPAGTGNACAKHSSYRVCQICELPHDGLYCSNCFTGERVRVGARKFAKVIRLQEIIK